MSYGERVHGQSELKGDQPIRDGLFKCRHRRAERAFPGPLLVIWTRNPRHLVNRRYQGCGREPSAEEWDGPCAAQGAPAPDDQVGVER